MSNPWWKKGDKFLTFIYKGKLCFENEDERLCLEKGNLNYYKKNEDDEYEFIMSFGKYAHFDYLFKNNHWVYDPTDLTLAATIYRTYTTQFIPFESKYATIRLQLWQEVFYIMYEYWLFRTKKA